MQEQTTSELLDPEELSHQLEGKPKVLVLIPGVEKMSKIKKRRG